MVEVSICFMKSNGGSEPCVTSPTQSINLFIYDLFKISHNSFIFSQTFYKLNVISVHIFKHIE